MCASCERSLALILTVLQVMERRLAALESGRPLTVAPDHTTSKRPARTDALKEAERQLVVDALKAHGGVQKHAAVALGMTARRFHYAVHKHRLAHLCRYAR